MNEKILLEAIRNELSYSLNSFQVCNLDESNATNQYYGFMNKDMNWYLMRKTVLAPDIQEIKFFRGNSRVTADYETAWSNRTTLSYNYFGITF